jgi:hypothetical protein
MRVKAWELRAAPLMRGVEVTFHERIGPHDITIVKVNRLDDFLEWIRNFTQARGLGVKEIPSEFVVTVKEYLNQGIRFFVFDVIEVMESERSIDPIVYRFPSDYLYYPLKITAASEVGWSFSSINLFFSPKVG